MRDYVTDSFDESAQPHVLCQVRLWDTSERHHSVAA